MKLHKFLLIITIVLLTNKPSKAFQVDTLKLDVVGKVVDSDGNSLQGITINVKGSNKSTFSNNLGNFALKGVEVGSTLIISGINILTLEIKTSNNPNLGTISTQQKISEGDEVVVEANTGYQKKKPNELNGALFVLDNKTINRQTGTNILKRLDGQVPGLYFNIGKSNNNPQSNTEISIRGLGSINGPLDPIIVLDDFIYEGRIENINPNDIESITILKDAASTSIYGARGGNGVIVLTTKKGKINNSIQIDVNSNLIIGDKPDLFKLNQMTSSDYIDVEEYIFNKGYFDNQITSNLYPALTPAVEVFQNRKTGLISSADSALLINKLKTIDNRKDFDNYFYNRSVTQQHHISLRGGSEKMIWLISGGYEKANGTLKSVDQKTNLRFENIYKPLSNLQVEIGAIYSNSKSTSGSIGYGDLSIGGSRLSVPYLQLLDENKNPLPIANKYSNFYLDTAGQGLLNNWHYYPYNEHLRDVFTSSFTEYIAKLGVNWNILKNLNLRVNYQIQNQQNLRERHSDEESYYTRDLINRFSVINWNTSTITYPIPKGSILQNSTSQIKSQNLRGQLDYATHWRRNSISFLIGGEFREIINEGVGNTVYGYNQDPLRISRVNYNQLYRDYTTGYFITIPGSPFKAATLTNRFVSLYTNLSYQLNEKYSITGSFRKDGSNIFGLNTNDKWKPLWSIGSGWVISNESAFKKLPLKYLKLRLTYGYSGNVNLGLSPLPIAYSDRNFLTNLPYARITTINNPELRWEEIRQTNIALDFAFKKRKISGSIDYYFKKGVDLYGETPYDYTAWGYLPEIVKNVASMKGTGVDLSLSSVNIDKALKWTTTVILSYNSSKTTKYNKLSAQKLTTLLGGSANTIRPVVNKPLYAIVAYKWAGLDNLGNPQGLLNGEKSTDYQAIRREAELKGIESGAIKYIGPANPIVFGSFMNSISYRKLTLLFSISYKFGYYFRKPTISYSALINSGVGHKDYEKRWQNVGDESKTNIPSFVYTDYPQFGARDNFFLNSEINILKADNIRFQFINIEYDLLSPKYKNSKSKVQLYFNLSNIGIIWRSNKEKIDPDYPNALQPPKYYTIGVRTSF